MRTKMQVQEEMSLFSCTFVIYRAIAGAFLAVQKCKENAHFRALIQTELH